MPHWKSGRLDEQPITGSLGLLPSGPDPVGERYVRKPTSRRAVWARRWQMASTGF